MTDREYRTYKMPLYTPLCLAHKCRMIAVHSKAKVTYYKCPESGCPNTSKAPRVDFTPAVEYSQGGEDLQPAAGREYSDRAMKEACERHEGRRVRLDHPDE